MTQQTQQTQVAASLTKLATESSLSQDQLKLIIDTVAKGATLPELQLFLYTAKRVGLDPLTKQIHFIKRRNRQPDGTYKEVGTIQTGIDGYRAIAERTGTLAGIDDAVFDDESKQHPNKASVTVYRIVDGQRVGFTASARWSEYAQMKGDRPTSMWAKMPYLMLGKCAEALALRKAFPNDLSGLYTNEEMSQADTDSSPAPQQSPRIEAHGVTNVEIKETPSEAVNTPQNASNEVTEDIDTGKVFHCSVTGKEITEAEYKYSLAHFGKPLCRMEQVVERGKKLNK